MAKKKRQATSKKQPRKELRALTKRIAAIEAQVTETKADTSPANAAVTGDDGSWALRRLQEGVASAGGVLVAGAVDLPAGERVEWQAQDTTSALLESDWTDATPRLTALAHPIRLELLRHILRGTRSTTDLAQLELMGTTGQLYHHLNQLRAAGWLRQTGRGRYVVPAERVVPLLAVLAATRSPVAARPPGA